METIRSLINGSFSAIGVTATLSIALLLGVSVWRVVTLLQANADATSYVASAPVKPKDALTEQELILLGFATSSDPSAISTMDPISLIGPQVIAQLVGQYEGLSDAGIYTKETGEAAAAKIAENVKAAITYRTYDASMMTIDEDISTERMLAYRSDLREALVPLFKNTNNEFEIYAQYVESNDPIYLEQLTKSAVNYRDAASLAAKVAVPKDALNYHLAILNAMERFAATLDAMVAHADDPFGSVALVRTYNEAEAGMFNTFNALGGFYSKKI